MFIYLCKSIYGVLRLNSLKVKFNLSIIFPILSLAKWLDMRAIRAETVIQEAMSKMEELMSALKGEYILTCV